MIEMETNQLKINGKDVNTYCKKHCESCNHYLVCDNKNKNGLSKYFVDIYNGKKNNALFDNVKYECPYYKKEENNTNDIKIKTINLYSVEEVLDLINKNIKLKNKLNNLKEENDELKRKCDELDNMRLEKNKIINNINKKNKELKNTLNILAKRNYMYDCEINNLLNVNEMLREENERLKNKRMFI